MGSGRDFDTAPCRAAAIFVPKIFALKILECRLRADSLDIAVKTSGGHLLI